MTAKARKGRGDALEIGDEVKVMFGNRELIGTIVEDRGRIGVRGRRMVRVRVFLESDGEISFDLPAEELVPAA